MLRWISTVVATIAVNAFAFGSEPIDDKRNAPNEGSPAAEAIAKVTARPEKVLIERDPAGQYLNFDFVVENLKDQPVQIRSIEASVYDAKNKLSFRRAVDSGGFSPAIETIPNREVAAKETTLVFNPFYRFEPYLELARIRFEFSFITKNDKKESKVEVAITPTYYETKTKLMLPVKRRVQVESGHDFYAHHRRLNYFHPLARQLGFKANFMRYGYDFFVVDAEGNQKTGSGDRFEDYLGFGVPLYAPAAGRVVALANDFPEDLFGRNLTIQNLTKEPLLFSGNYLLIDHLNGEYSLLVHLKHGSVTPKLGDMVKQGQQIAQIGCSGSAERPHLHYELQSGGGFDVEGLPSYFENFRRILGTKTVDVKKGRIDSGDIVESR
jgi:hypothetical protein